MIFDDYFYDILKNNDSKNRDFSPFRTSIGNALSIVNEEYQYPQVLNEGIIYGFYRVYDMAQRQHFHLDRFHDSFTYTEKFPLETRVNFGVLPKDNFMDLFIGTDSRNAAIFSLLSEQSGRPYLQLFTLSATPTDAWSLFGYADNEINTLGLYPPVSDLTKKIPKNLGEGLTIAYLETLILQNKDLYRGKLS